MISILYELRVKMKLHKGYRVGMLLMLFPLLLPWKGMKCQSSNKNTIRVRQSATVQEGLCITIPCGFTANYKSTFRNATGLWITNKNVTVASSNPSYTRRKPNFLITGNPNNGNCTLTITGAKKEDSGSYFFRFKEPSASQVDYNSSVSVQVTDLKEKPKIWMPDELIAGKEVKLGCVPPGNCPGKPRVQWKKSNVVGTWMKLAGFSFTPTQNDHQKSVTCEVITLTGKIITAQHILSISYPPANMKITISSSTGRNIDLNGTIVISEKEFLILNCSVEANPPARVFWNKSNHIKQDNTIAEGMIWSAINITEPNIYRCFASNKYGINETFMDIKAEKDLQQRPEVTIATLNCIMCNFN
ncbi:sialic acid-binding Ig-like lectin 13 [Aquarana catesbeiana]|uniref:sialic acid-binding Ig-like lectin 13 n=1 Tax=Aquarana catesbeiana TaxID=8400 RepID=UPI003CCA5539